MRKDKQARDLIHKLHITVLSGELPSSDKRLTHAIMDPPFQNNDNECLLTFTSTTSKANTSYIYLSILMPAPSIYHKEDGLSRSLHMNLSMHLIFAVQSSHFPCSFSWQFLPSFFLLVFLPFESHTIYLYCLNVPLPNLSIHSPFYSVVQHFFFKPSTGHHFPLLSS